MAWLRWVTAALCVHLCVLGLEDTAPKTTGREGRVARRLRTTKCQYTLVFHEMDMSQCPSAIPRTRDTPNSLSQVYQDTVQDSPSAMRVPANNPDPELIRSLKDRVDGLETRLFEEKVHNRELKTTMVKQEQKLNEINKILGGQSQNTSMMENVVRGFQINLLKHRSHMKSIEEKLAGVMLDVDEMNHMLLTRDLKKSSKLEDKTIPVESLAEVSHCNIPDNITTFKDCEQVYNRGHVKSGIYYVTTLYTPCPIPVYCDMDTPPGGWLVLMRRSDGDLDFDRKWAEYRKGFGDVTKEFWLGNANMFLLTNQLHYQLRVDMWDFYGSRVYAEYRHFQVDGERDRYRLRVSNHSGTAADGLASHNGMRFSTPDQDNDAYSEYHCAKEWGAGWWFSNCWFVILTGQYYNTTEVEYKGIAWNDWKNEQLKHVEMKMRPSGY